MTEATEERLAQIESAGDWEMDGNELKWLISQVRELTTRAEAAEAKLAERDSFIANYIHATKIERAELEASLAAAAEDTADLDWLDGCKFGAWGKELFAGELAAKVQLEARGDHWKGWTLRAAIRAARKTTGA